MLGTVLRASEALSYSGFEASPWVVAIATHAAQVGKVGLGMFRWVEEEEFEFS